MPHSARRRARTVPIVVALVSALAGSTATAQLPTIAAKTEGFEKIDGFVPLYWDAAAGKLWLEIGRFDTELLYIVSLPHGLGSNDIGLDRGQIGGEQVVRFHRIGPKVLMIQPNYERRARSDDPAERRAVRESFAESVLWGFKVEAESDGAVLVDGTEFALRDAHGVIGALRRTRQGTFRLDGSRSALALDRTKGFPRNTEIEVILTFTSDDPGRWVRDVAPTAGAVTVHERHSFVALPDPGYEPRASDPRGGFFGISFVDYATPIGDPIEQRFIARHRLEKRNPGAAISEPVKPIVYYVDRGAPEPVRSALIEGASWWNEAFEAAGYRNAFRVEVMPEGADPMDVRYNMIQWVHRATRGWSYGGSVTDPRTGEIIKGHVTLGSLRVRQDYLIAQGLLSPFVEGDEAAPALQAMALGRIRQLAAHEVGHTLGIQHNFIASTVNRASVMDYPHPLATVGADGSIDLSRAYASGIGAWDKAAVKYGYQALPAGAGEKASLGALIDSARAQGLLFLTDQDARSPGSAHPQAHLWDNGVSASAELKRVMDVRRAALRHFGERSIERGAPMATLEEVLVPVYLHHRYQTEAAVKIIGGQYYDYVIRGDGQTPVREVPAAEQEAALDALLETIAPGELALPRSILALIPPRPATYPAHRELFPRATGLVFDAVSPATAAASITVSLLLDQQRAARLVEQHALDPALPGLGQVLDRLIVATFDVTPTDPYQAEVARAVQRVAVDQLMRLGATALMAQVRAIVGGKLSSLGDRPVKTASESAEDLAARALFAADIRRFLERPYDPTRLPTAPDAPPGSPIGAVQEIIDIP